MTKPPKRKTKPTAKGFACPDCRGQRLFVRDTVRPMPGLIRRYRECVVCGFRVVTEERKQKAKA